MQDNPKAGDELGQQLAAMQAIARVVEDRPALDSARGDVIPRAEPFNPRKTRHKR